MPRVAYECRYEHSWAVVVGINDYKYSGCLAYARNDAQAFADHLITKRGFPKQNVSLLVDGKATLNNIRASIHRLVRDSEPDDRVVFFYAGHGHTVQTNGFEAGFLVPVDGNAEDTATLLPWDDLVSTSRLISAKHMLFVMDACYGGLIGMRSLAPGTKRLLRDMLTRYSRQFLTAGKADELVADGGGPRAGHSLFSGHLLNALEDDAAFDNGVISANTIMARVYDRVSNDPHSRQAPHYGFLSGDGDLFFSAPQYDDVSDDSTTAAFSTLIEIPADLVPQQPEQEMPLQEQIKEYLADPKDRIRLNDLVMRELRASQQRVSEEHFPLHSFAADEVASRLLKYEEAVRDILDISVLLGRWAQSQQQSDIRQIVNVLAGRITMKSGSTIWLGLRAYPMLMAMYAGGIAAIEGGIYESLRTFLATPVQNERRQGATTVTVAVSGAMNETIEAFKCMPKHSRDRTPISEYLFKRVQPIVEDILFIGDRYEDIFDQFEILYALSHADHADHWWGYVGRFAWKYRSHGATNNPFLVTTEEAKKAGDDWPPLQAGLFQGSYSRFAEVAERYKTQLLDQLKWF